MVSVLLPAVMAPVGFLSCEVDTWRTCCILGAENHDAATVLAVTAKWNTRALVSGLDYQRAWEAVDLWSGKAVRDCELSLIFWARLGLGLTRSWWTSSRLLPTSSRYQSTRLPLVEDQESTWRNRYGLVSESQTSWWLMGEGDKKVFLLAVFLSCVSSSVDVWITRFLCYVMVRVFTCTVFIVFTMMWFGCFLVPVEARLFCRVSSVQLLWGRCVRQLWGSTSASHSQVVVSIGFDRKCDSLQRFCQNY